MVGLRLSSSSTAGYDSFGPPLLDSPPRGPSCRDTVAGGSWGGDKDSRSGDDGGGCAKASAGDGGSGAESSGVGRGSASGRGRMTAATGGLLVWATVASLAAVWLAAGRGGFEENGGGHTHRTEAAASAPPTADSSGSFVATSASAPPLKLKSKSDTWCLPNAAMQNFSGVVLKEEDGLLPQGKWEGQHWWYHDEITSGFHMVVTIGGETYGFWDLGILGASGNTEYVAAYKGDDCLFYQEEVQPGSSPFDDDVTCRGSAWAGNVTLEEEVEFGYGTKAERWAGTILDIEDDNAKYGGLPPGTESLVDLQRNPRNNGEVRLLYHRVVAPTRGVLGWAGGDSISFDLIFTGLESMTASDVLELVKVPSICEVMAGEFHDQQARGGETNINPGDGVPGGGRALRTTATRGRTSSSSLQASRENSQAAAVAADAAEKPDATASAPAWRRRRKRRGEEVEENRPARAGAGAGAGAGSVEAGRGANSVGVVGLSERSSGGSGGGARQVARSLETVAKDEDREEEEEEQGAENSGVQDDGVGGGGGGEGSESHAAPTAAVAAAGLLPIHQLLRSLGPRGYRHRG